MLPAYLVADFKTAVKKYWPDNMRRVDAGKLIVWRRTNPHLFTSEEPESINFTNDTAIVLDDLATIASLCLFDEEMLIVQIPGTYASLVRGNILTRLSCARKRP